MKFKDKKKVFHLFSDFEERVTKPVCYRSLKTSLRITPGGKFSMWQDSLNRQWLFFEQECLWSFKGTQKLRKELSQEEQKDYEHWKQEKNINRSMLQIFWHEIMKTYAMCLGKHQIFTVIYNYCLHIYYNL